MVNNLKRYKRLIDTILKWIDKDKLGYSRWSYFTYRVWCKDDLGCTVDIVIDYEDYIKSVNSFRVYEDNKGRIYIGFDLDKINLKAEPNYILNNSSEVSISLYSLEAYFIRKGLGEDALHTLRSVYPDSMFGHRRMINPELLKHLWNENCFLSFRNFVEDICKGKYKLQLSDESLPLLKCRSILPIVMISFEDDAIYRFEYTSRLRKEKLCSISGILSNEVSIRKSLLGVSISIPCVNFKKI